MDVPYVGNLNMHFPDVTNLPPFLVQILIIMVILGLVWSTLYDINYYWNSKSHEELDKTLSNKTDDIIL